MLMAVVPAVRDESGTTLVELLVGLMMGMVILTALTLVVIVTMHGSARVSARVEATQNGRVVLARMTEQLHSACIYPKVAPILAGSTGTSLAFVHAASGEGNAVSPAPVKTVFTLSEGTLTQSDAAVTEGAEPPYGASDFAATPTTRTLMTNVAPIAPSSSIFTYYAYANGGLETLPANPLSETNAAKTVQVQIALDAAPRTTPVKDAGADASIRDAAVLRLTPPSFNETATALPCR